MSDRIALSRIVSLFLLVRFLQWHFCILPTSHRHRHRHHHNHHHQRPGFARFTFNIKEEEKKNSKIKMKSNKKATKWQKFAGWQNINFATDIFFSSIPGISKLFSIFSFYNRQLKFILDLIGNKKKNRPPIAHPHQIWAVAVHLLFVHSRSWLI